MSRPAPVQERIEPAEPYDAGNERHVAEAKRTAKEVDALRADGLRHLLGNEGSRAWLFSVLERCGVFTTSFTGNSETFFREGQRNIGLFIIAELMRTNPTAYARMLEEAKVRGEKGSRAKALKPIDGEE